MAILFGTMAVCLLLGVPIGAAIGAAILMLNLLQPFTTMEYITQYMYSGVSSFTLLALPFFIISGNLMDTGGISKRLIKIANSLIGNVVGGLGTVTVLACMFFGAISGSANATVAAIGIIMIPQMVRAGYNKYYAVALVTVAGGLGCVVPPSYPLVIYGVTNNQSISDLFLAGIGPALLVGGMLILVNYCISRKYGWKGSGEPVSIKRFFIALKDGIWAIFMPIIILGGIYGGIFTATEAAVVATVYSILVGIFIYRELTLKKIWKMFFDTTAAMGGMNYTMATAGALSSVFVYLGFGEKVQNFFFGISDSTFVIMLIIFAILFIVGMFVQTTPTIIIVSPILLQIVTPLGIHPIQFGLVMTLSLCIAFVTPPVASNLFVAQSMTGLDVGGITKWALPFILVLFVAMALVAFFPMFSMGILALFR
ncbi:TRAP transporter large permease [Anaerotruncus rubiinfantis]|uniref:TRAP transporter large permease n=1 Tax=Anaerotruncus rubiinfantis TaxID=1720200 RepID=UPI00082F0DB6|nr:TRAP transporter large permease [Anaerotruncus rubiinfantis]